MKGLNKLPVKSKLHFIKIIHQAPVGPYPKRDFIFSKYPACFCILWHFLVIFILKI